MAKIIQFPQTSGPRRAGDVEKKPQVQFRALESSQDFERWAFKSGFQNDPQLAAFMAAVGDGRMNAQNAADMLRAGKTASL